MTRLRDRLGHPFWQALLVLVLAYAVIRFGIRPPVPQSIVLQYMLTVAVALLIYVSENEDRWRRFKQPIRDALVEPRRRGVRVGMLIALPVLVGWVTLGQTRGAVSAPAALRTIHPAPPTQFTFRGRSLRLTEMANPLRSTGSLDQHYLEGRRLYYQNCLPCHGDLLDGRGHYGHGFNPTPLPFDVSTIAQLSEAFVFWRIAKGGPGLPREGTPWNSAMPVWEDFLTEEEIWKLIIFLYRQAGVEPRRLTEEHQ